MHYYKLFDYKFDHLYSDFYELDNQKIILYNQNYDSNTK